MIRKADLAGAWYRADTLGLSAEVDACIDDAKRLLADYAPEPTGEPVSVIVPHAGLAYSGPLAAAAFLRVREAFENVDAFVVFGACHRARISRPAIWNKGAWETPLGPIDIDEELAETLIGSGLGNADFQAHLGDNSIELQTPFIKRLFPDAKMVPIAMSFFPDAWRIGESVAAMTDGKRIVAVGSTDLTHYGASFGVTPAGTGEPALAWAGENDRRFLDTLLNLNLDAIVPTASRDGSACGAGAAAAAAGWAKANGCRNGTLLAHANSYEIAPRGDASHFVGYASIVYEMEA